MTHEIVNKNQKQYLKIYPVEKNQTLLKMMNICISKTKSSQSFLNADYCTKNYQSTAIILSKDYYEDVQYLYSTLIIENAQSDSQNENQSESQSEKQTQTQNIINFDPLDYIELEFDQSLLFSINGKKQEEKTFILNWEAVNTPRLLYAISSKIEEFEMIVYQKQKGSQTKIKRINTYHSFYNGFAVILPSLSKSYEMIIIIKATSKTTPLITLKNRLLAHDQKLNANSKSNYTYIVLENEIIYGIFDYENNLECFIFKQKENNNESYSINIIAFSYAINFTQTKRPTIIDDSVTLTLEKSNSDLLCFQPYSKKSHITNVGYSFQIINNKIDPSKQIFLNSILNGRPIKATLQSNHMFLYHLENQLDYFDYTEINIKRELSSNLQVYGGACVASFNCDFNVLNLNKDLIKVKDINNIFHITLKALKTKDPFIHIAIVHCNSTDPCNYIISMSHEEDLMVLTTDSPIYKSLQKGKKHKYIFNQNSWKFEQNYISFNLYSFTGHNKINIYRDKEMTKRPLETVSYERDKIIYDLKSLEMSESNTKYYIEVIGLSNCYYSLQISLYDNLKNKTEVKLIGDIFIETLTLQHLQKNIVFKSTELERKDSKGFFITTSSLNGDIIFEFDNLCNNESDYLFFISNTHSVWNNESYLLSARHVINTSEPQITMKEYLVLIAGFFLSEHQELLLLEGYKHTIVLTKELKTITYNYPYYYDGAEDNLLISMKANNPGIAFFAYNINNNSYSKDCLIDKMDKLVITAYQLNKHCYQYNICSIIIKIIKEKEDNVIVSIQVTASNAIPIYLVKDQTRIDCVFEKRVQYYYTDVFDKTEGEIIIRFLKGSGYAIAKLINKNTKEQNPNWKYIHLPDENEINPLPYNYYSSQIKYKGTSKCKNEGCELYIVIYSCEKESTLFSNFYITIHEYNKPFQIILNQPLFGVSDYSSEPKRYYFLKIPENINTLSIHYNCLHCIIMLEIENTLLEQNEKDFLIDLNNTKWNNKNERKISFFLKDVPIGHLYYPYEPFDLIVKVIDSDKEIDSDNVTEQEFLQQNICNLSLKKDNKCRYIIKIHDYDYLTHYLIAAFHLNNVIPTQIYIHQVSESEYYKLNSSELSKKFPDEENYTLRSHNSIVNFQQKLQDKLLPTSFLFVTISSRNHDSIIFLSNWGHSPKSTLLIPNTNQIFTMNNNETMILNIAIRQRSLCVIRRLVGSGNVYVYKLEPNYTYVKKIDENKEKVIIIFPSSSKNLKNIFYQIHIHTDESDFGFSVVYSAIYQGYFSDQINFEMFSFASLYYTEMVYNNLNLFIPIQDTKSTNFFINLYCDRKFLKKYQNKFQIVTNPHENIRQIKIHNRHNFFFDNISLYLYDLDNYQFHYFFLRMNLLTLLNNQNQINQTELKVLVYPGEWSNTHLYDETKPLPQGIFMIFYLRNKYKQEFILRSTELFNSLMFLNIEIITKINIIDIEISPIEKNHDGYKTRMDNSIESNNSSVNKQIFKYIVKQDEIGVKLNINYSNDKTKTTNDEKDDEKDLILPYALKYTLTNQILNNSFIKTNEMIEIFQYDKSINISFNPIINANNTIIPGDYMIGLYNASIFSTNITDQEKANLILTDEPLFKFDITFNGDNDKVYFSTDEIQIGKYYICIVGTVNHYHHEERLQYTPLLFEMKEKESSSAVIIILILVCIVIIVLGILFYKNKQNEIDNETFREETLTEKTLTKESLREETSITANSNTDLRKTNPSSH